MSFPILEAGVDISAEQVAALRAGQVPANLQSSTSTSSTPDDDSDIISSTDDSTITSSTLDGDSNITSTTTVSQESLAPAKGGSWAGGGVVIALGFCFVSLI